MNRTVDYISEMVGTVAFQREGILLSVYKIDNETIIIYCETIKNN